MRKFVEFNDVYKRYKMGEVTINAANGISFGIEEGEFAIVVGPSGAAEIAAMIGASIALSISDIPFDGPTGSVAVGLIDGEFILNPTEAQREASDLSLTVAAEAPGTPMCVIITFAQIIALLFGGYEHLK